MMVSKDRPFENTSTSDPLYKWFYINRVDMFWKFHAWSKSNSL